MRKKRVFALLSCFLVMIILSLYTTPIFAMESSQDELFTHSKKYISQEVAQDYANQMIDEMKESELYLWNDSTVIDEVIPMYDFEGNINSYLFRLKTNGIKQGYIVVDAKSETAGVEICNDTGEYAVDKISKQKLGRPINKKDFIIRPGTFYFVVEQDNQTYVNFSTGDIECQ